MQKCDGIGGWRKVTKTVTSILLILCWAFCWSLMSDDQPQAYHSNKKLANLELPQQIHHLTPRPLLYVNFCVPSCRAPNGHATKEETDTQLMRREEMDT